MLLFLLAQLTPALANGQTTHLWITEQARSHLSDGALAELLTAESAALRVGTMFPDGGYAIGHDYGEVAHWEPFQELFRDWIMDNFDDIESEEAAPYVAFYMGLASHGMADQVFDSMYMERSRIYDAEHGWVSESHSLDTSQDIVFGSLTGGQPLSEFELPGVLPSLFNEAGIDVDMSTLQSGQGWLEIAVTGVSVTSQDPDLVELHSEAFPWGCSHLLDEDVAGAPPMEAEIVARYWQALWAELSGEEVDLKVIGQWPREGATGHSDDVEDVEARLSVVFNKGMYEAAISSRVFHVESDEQELPIELDLFYWTYSHVVNISPTEGWLEEADHQLVIAGDIEATDGRRLSQPFTLNFSTRPDASGMNTSATACGCTAARSSAPTWLLTILGTLALILTRRRP
jgi:hypothetical protein